MTETTKDRISKADLWWAGVFCLMFVGIQIFQQIVFAAVPMGNDSSMELRALADPLHIARSVGVFVSLVLLMYPYAVFAQFGPTPVMRTLIVVFFAFFVIFEIGYRSVELFVVQLQWGVQAMQPELSNDSLAKYELYQEVIRPIYFPLMLSHGIASGLAGWFVPFQGIDRLLKAALLLNAFRLALRIGGAFGGIQWMNVLTGTYFFPFILLVFVPLTLWCFFRSRSV